MNVSEFYERYWQRPGGAVPERGFALEERKALLKAALANPPQRAPVLDAGCGLNEFTLERAGFAVERWGDRPALAAVDGALCHSAQSGIARPIADD